MSTFAPRVLESYLDSSPHPIYIPALTLSTFQATPVYICPAYTSVDRNLTLTRPKIMRTTTKVRLINSMRRNIM